MILLESKNGAYFHFVLEGIAFGWIICIVRVSETAVELAFQPEVSENETE